MFIDSYSNPSCSYIEMEITSWNWLLSSHCFTNLSPPLSDLLTEYTNEGWFQGKAGPELYLLCDKPTKGYLWTPEAETKAVLWAGGSGKYLSWVNISDCVSPAIWIVYKPQPPDSAE